jgi:hypothetical protein
MQLREVNIGTVVANSNSTAQVSYYNRLKSNVNTFAKASLISMYKDLKDNNQEP